MTITNDDDITLQIGFEQYYNCLNNSGYDISENTFVYATGISDQKITIAEYSMSLNPGEPIGLLVEDIKNNKTGHVMSIGAKVLLAKHNKTYTL